MADTATLAAQNRQIADSEDAQDQQAAYLRSQRDASSAYGQDGAPAYGGGAGIPKRDFPYEEYLNHVLGTSTFNQYGIAVDGPYKGLHKGEVIDKTRDDFAKFSPEERAPWENRVHMRDVHGQDKGQGFQYQDQYDQYANKSPEIGTNGQALGSAGTPPASTPAPAWNPMGSTNTPVSMNSNTYGQTSPQGSGSNLPAPAWNGGSMNPGMNGSGVSLDGLDSFRSQPSYHQADAIPANQRFMPPTNQGIAGTTDNQSLANPANFNSTNSNFRAMAGMPNQLPPMGDKTDVARYGPALSGSGSLADVTARANIPQSVVTTNLRTVPAPALNTALPPSPDPTSTTEAPTTPNVSQISPVSSPNYGSVRAASEDAQNPSLRASLEDAPNYVATPNIRVPLAPPPASTPFSRADMLKQRGQERDAAANAASRPPSPTGVAGMPQTAPTYKPAPPVTPPPQANTRV